MRQKIILLIISFSIILMNTSLISAINTDYVVNDHLGSASVIIDSVDDSVVWSADYEPFGSVFNEQKNNDDVGADAVNNRFSYNAKEQDDSTGFFYYDARYYDAGLGRFLSADSIIGKAGNPQELNRYAYVKNNPISFVDPSGNLLTVADKKLGEFAAKTFNKPLGVSAFSYNPELKRVILNEGFEDYNFDDSRKQLLFNNFKNLVTHEAEVTLMEGDKNGFISPDDYKLDGLKIQLNGKGMILPLGENGADIKFTPEIILIHESAHASGYLRVHDIIADKLKQGYTVSEFYQYGKFDNIATVKRIDSSTDKSFHKTHNFLYVNTLTWKETHAVGLENRARELLGMKRRVYYAPLKNDDGSLYGLITPQRFDERFHNRQADFLFNPKNK